MVKRYPKEVRKHGHLTKETNPYGVHDRFAFHNHMELVLRCPKCNNMMAGDFTSERECPNCHWRFTKMRAVDMCVEAYTVKVYGGWSVGVQQLLERYDRSVILGPKGDVREIDEAARNMYAWAIQQLRKRDMENRYRSDDYFKMVDHLRSNAANAELM